MSKLMPLTTVPLGGFGKWQRIAALGRGMELSLGRPLLKAAIFDRDYYCDDEIEEMRQSLSQSIDLPYTHGRKELENYLLIPEAIDRAVVKAVGERRRRGHAASDVTFSARRLLEDVTRDMREAVTAQKIAKLSDFTRRCHARTDTSTLAESVLREVKSAWDSLDTRLRLVPGKETFARVAGEVQRSAQVAISATSVISSMDREEIPLDLKNLLNSLEQFRSQVPPESET